MNAIRAEFGTMFMKTPVDFRLWTGTEGFRIANLNLFAWSFNGIATNFKEVFFIFNKFAGDLFSPYINNYDNGNIVCLV